MNWGSKTWAALGAMAVLMLSVPNAARAESGRLNLHLDLGGGVPILGPAAVGSDGVDSVYGGVFLLGVDYQLAPPIAIELLGGGGFFHVSTDLGSDTNAYGSVTVGARFRFMDNHEGHMNEEGGDPLGNFWASAHIGWHRFIETSSASTWALATSGPSCAPCRSGSSCAPPSCPAVTTAKSTASWWAASIFRSP